MVYTVERNGKKRRGEERTIVETEYVSIERTIKGAVHCTVLYLMQYLVGISRLPLPKSTATHDLFVLLL
jgi:hypothetical protein